MRKRKLVAEIDRGKCIRCGECVIVCFKIKHPSFCSGCGKCLKSCPSNAISLTERI